MAGRTATVKEIQKADPVASSTVTTPAVTVPDWVVALRGYANNWQPLPVTTQQTGDQSYNNFMANRYQSTKQNPLVASSGKSNAEIGQAILSNLE